MIINYFLKHWRQICITFFLLSVLLADSNQIVSSINVSGAKSVKKNQIYSLMRTKIPTLFSSQKFDQRILRLDAITIKTYFISKGFLEVQVEDSLEINGEKVNIFLKISEGKQYMLRSLKISGNNKSRFSINFYTLNWF